VLSPVSIQTQSLALRALRKRKPQETQAIAFEWKLGFTSKLSVTGNCFYNTHRQTQTHRQAIPKQR